MLVLFRRILFSVNHDKQRETTIIFKGMTFELHSCSMDSHFSDNSFKKPVHAIILGICSGTHTCSCNELLCVPVQRFCMKILNRKKYCQKEVLCTLLVSYTQPHTKTTEQLILEPDIYNADKFCSSG